MMKTRTAALLLSTSLFAALASGALAQDAPADRDQTNPGKHIALAALPNPDQTVSQLPALVGVASLELAFDQDSLDAHVGGVEDFFGVVVLSISPATVQLADGLPLLLADSVVMGAGKGDWRGLYLSLPCKPQQRVALWGQAAVFTAEGMMLSTIVEAK
jgi:hypothetical protein